MNNPFNKIDEKLNVLRKDYKDIEQDTIDELEDILNSVELTDEPLTTAEKNKLKRYVDRVKEEDFFSDLVLSYITYILSKKVLVPADIVEIKTIVLLDNKYKLYDKINENNFKQFLNIGYNNCLNDIKKTSKIDFDALYNDMITKPINGTVYKDYLNAKLIKDVGQIKRQFQIDVQSNKLKSSNYKKIIQKQNKELIYRTEKNRIIGFIELYAEGLYNQGYIEACKDNKIKKVKFYGINDEVQTKMCHSLDGQEFYVDEINEFKRYSETSGTEIKYKIRGLVQGVNLPPITDNFHWCRSFVVAIT